MTSPHTSRSYDLVELFGSFRSPVLTDHDYFVAQPPAALALDRTELRALEVRKPFFVHRGWSVGPNRELVPFVWDPRSGGQPRFSEAEAFTDYDSGHFGLAAVSAPTGDDQAQLYTVLAQVIVDVHRANRSLMAEWFEAQESDSREIFVYFDGDRATAEEKLLAADGSIDGATWNARLEELAAGIEQRRFHKHHFRWVEFLAHAVDVPQLMGLIKGAQVRDQGPAE